MKVAAWAEHYVHSRLLADSIRRERRSRIGSEQNLDESKGSLFQSFEHFRKARVILRLLIVITCVAKMRFTSGISEFLHNESGLSVAQFCVVSLNFVTVRWFWISVEMDLLDHSGLLVLDSIFPVRVLGLQ